MIKSWMAKDRAGLFAISELLKSSIVLPPFKKSLNLFLPNLIKRARFTADQIENRPPVPISISAILFELIPKVSALSTNEVTA